MLNTVQLRDIITPIVAISGTSGIAVRTTGCGLATACPRSARARIS